MLLDKALILISVIGKPRPDSDQDGDDDEEILLFVTAQGGFDGHWVFLLTVIIVVVRSHCSVAEQSAE